MKHLLIILTGLFFTTYSIAQSETQSIEFGYTGAPQLYTIPSGVTTISVEMQGAQGGYGSWELKPYHDKYSPGKGGLLTATYAVTPGETIYIFVGEKGADATKYKEGKGGFNGGGDGNNTGTYGPYCGGGGGGATDIRIGGLQLENRVLVAGGGGGSGANYPDGGDHGGNGGDLNGVNGQAENGTKHESCGEGATQKKGGEGGQWPKYLKGGDGYLGNGGNAPDSTAGGGGGGGYFGGGAGCWSGGGGGSSYTHSNASGIKHKQGVISGHGMVVITIVYKDYLEDDEVELSLNFELDDTIATSEETLNITDSTVVITEEELIVELQDESDIVETESTSIQSDKVDSFIIYPNPTDGLLIIKGDAITSIDIYTLKGDLAFTSDRKQTLDVSSLKPGTYLVHGKDINQQLIGIEKLIIR